MLIKIKSVLQQFCEHELGVAGEGSGREELQQGGSGQGILDCIPLDAVAHERLRLQQRKNNQFFRKCLQCLIKLSTIIQCCPAPIESEVLREHKEVILAMFLPVRFGSRDLCEPPFCGQLLAENRMPHNGLRDDHHNFADGTLHARHRGAAPAKSRPSSWSDAFAGGLGICRGAAGRQQQAHLLGTPPHQQRPGIRRWVAPAGQKNLPLNYLQLLIEVAQEQPFLARVEPLRDLCDLLDGPLQGRRRAGGRCTSSKPPAPACHQAVDVVDDFQGLHDLFQQLGQGGVWDACGLQDLALPLNELLKGHLPVAVAVSYIELPKN
mmetsp:Transcript_18573/g.32964  ORF Transcript_18573/g.32964 Transcript_18573/m.32964 type:complete len:322 (-) Transcript_18573:539-1504(-)